MTGVQTCALPISSHGGRWYGWHLAGYAVHGNEAGTDLAKAYAAASMLRTVNEIQRQYDVGGIQAFAEAEEMTAEQLEAARSGRSTFYALSIRAQRSRAKGLEAGQAARIISGENEIILSDAIARAAGEALPPSSGWRDHDYKLQRLPASLFGSVFVAELSWVEQ